VISNQKVMLLTGGARIGQSVAEMGSRMGYHVILSYRTNRTAAIETARQLQTRGGTSNVFKADVSREPSVTALLAFIKKKYGRLDALVNMASDYEKAPYVSLNSTQWTRHLASNLIAGHLLVKKAAPLLIKNRGKVVHLVDWTAASQRPRYKGFLPYYTAKTALIGLMQAQALELAPHVLVNAIAPGPILPPKNLPAQENRDVIRQTPLGRWGGSREIAKAVRFLLETNFATGECLRVDGGRHLL